jgi:hypothetical protein
LDCRITNDGGGVLEISDIEENCSWLGIRLTPPRHFPFSIPYGTYQAYEISISTGSLTPDQYSTEIIFDHDSPTDEDPLHVPVILTVLPPLEYRPGDANMWAGGWPPGVISGDVTYLVNYFRRITSACNLDGFYCSADINGDCQVLGNDVTAFVNFFRGSGTIQYCPDYPPAWPTPGDIPAEAPPGWPNCE